VPGAVTAHAGELDVHDVVPGPVQLKVLPGGRFAHVPCSCTAPLGSGFAGVALSVQVGAWTLTVTLAGVVVITVAPAMLALKV
jgi:hypothetical protein